MKAFCLLKKTTMELILNKKVKIKIFKIIIEVLYNVS